MKTLLVLLLTLSACASEKNNVVPLPAPSPVTTPTLETFVGMELSITLTRPEAFIPTCTGVVLNNPLLADHEVRQLLYRGHYRLQGEAFCQAVEHACLVCTPIIVNGRTR